VCSSTFSVILSMLYSIVACFSVPPISLSTRLNFPKTGAGTGLLSLLAIQAGAAHVYAVEQHAGLARVARQIAQDNGMAGRVTVLAMASSAVTPAMLEHAHDGHCDLVVSELLDFSLFGEGMLPALRDARRRLLHADAEAVPSGARLYGQAIASKGAAALRLQPLGGAPARVLGLHARALEPASAMTEPALLYKVTLDGSEDSAASARLHPRAPLPEHMVRLPVLGTTGSCDAVVLWWELDVGRGDAPAADTGAPLSASDSGQRGDAETTPAGLRRPWTSSLYTTDVTISTHPAVADIQGFQDHWPQGAWVWSDPVPLEAGQHLSVLVQCEDAVAVTLTPVSSMPSSLDALPQPFFDGVALPHLLAARLSAMSSASAARALTSMLKRTVSDHSVVLDVADGGRCTALLADASAHGLPQPKTVISLQPVEECRAWLRWQLQHLASCSDAESPVRVHLWAGAEAGEGWQEDWPMVDTLVSDLYTLSMGNRPLWQALNFWHLRTALAPVLSAEVVIAPGAVRVMAAAVAAPELAASHAAVGQVAGLDHAAFDAAFASRFLPDSHFCLAEHRHCLLTHPVSLVTLSFNEPLALEDSSTLVREGTCELTPSAAAGAGQAHAIAVWLEAGDDDGDDRIMEGHPTRGGLAARQMLRWHQFDPQSPCKLRFALSVASGELDLWLETADGREQALLANQRPTSS
jgi:hypothetical protein